MPFPRASAIRGGFRAAQSSRPTARPQPWRQIGRRGYAAHGPTKASSDLPWAAGAVAFTLPTCWWLLSSSPEEAHGGLHLPHKPHGEAHHEKDDESEDESEGKEKSEDSDSGDDAKEAETPETPDTSDDEDEKEETSEGKTEGTTSGEKIVKPDAKGDKKLKVESEKGNKLGEEDGDKPATSGKPESSESQAGKQEGLTNTDTKHSTDPGNDPEKSQKGDGQPETAKSKGTVGKSNN